MSGWMWAAVVIVAVAAAGVGAWAVWSSRRTTRLRSTFGGEYDRTVQARGSQAEAEAELRDREKRREELEIEPLSPAARERYAARWREVQSQFVDTPKGAVRSADALVLDVMRERGYPMDDFEQRAADISVDHPDVVEHYRAAHAISNANERGEGSTEDLRQAMRHYRALLADLLVEGAADDDGRRPGETHDRERVM